MKIIEATDYKGMSRKAANIISAQVILFPRSVLGLATGSTPIGTYEQLIEWYQKGDVDFSGVTSVNLDEYCGLSPENPQSYHYYMKEIDLQLLGLGNTGHIGFNEPDDSFDKMTHRVALKPKTISDNSRFFASLDEVPKYAVTMGIKAIMQAKKIVMVVSGAEKAEILEKVLFGPVTPEIPASILQLHPNVTVVADRDAMKAVHEKHPVEE